MEPLKTERVRRGFMFWILLLVATLLPASSQGDTIIKKSLYHAPISNSGAGVGSAQITSKTVTVTSATGSTSSQTYDYMVKTFARPGATVTKVSVIPVPDSGYGTWEVTLCENGQIIGDCAYGDDGNLDIEGTIQLLEIHTSVPGGIATFNNALKTGNLKILLVDGSSGTFVRIM
jgi:hypothetical protein